MPAQKPVPNRTCFPRHFAGASLKRERLEARLAERLEVFPGISLGPH